MQPQSIARLGFNPLPSPKQGETRHLGRHHGKPLRFNPLPSPKQGETYLGSGLF